MCCVCGVGGWVGVCCVGLLCVFMCVKVCGLTAIMSESARKSKCVCVCVCVCDYV